MKDYIENTNYAASSLIELIWADFEALEHLKGELEELTADFQIKYQGFLANEFHPAANHYHAQMAQAYERIAESKAELEDEIGRVSESIDAKSASIASLSGSLLQLAKQGISLRYGKPENAPSGAELGGVQIKEIIWEGRNQAIHYENPKEISDQVVKLFEKVDAVRDDGVGWEPRSQINYTFDIVRFLGWYTYEQYQEHMLSLVGKKGR